MKTRKNQYEKWRDKKLPKAMQEKIDSFANAPDVAEENERIFRAGWMAYCLLSPTFEGEEKNGKRSGKNA